MQGYRHTSGVFSDIHCKGLYGFKNCFLRRNVAILSSTFLFTVRIPWSLTGPDTPWADATNDKGTWILQGLNVGTKIGDTEAHIQCRYIS